MDFFSLSSCPITTQIYRRRKRAGEDAESDEERRAEEAAKEAEELLLEDTEVLDEDSLKSGGAAAAGRLVQSTSRARGVFLRRKLAVCDVKEQKRRLARRRWRHALLYARSEAKLRQMSDVLRKPKAGESVAERLLAATQKADRADERSSKLEHRLDGLERTTALSRAAREAEQHQHSRLLQGCSDLLTALDDPSLLAFPNETTTPTTPSDLVATAARNAAAKLDHDHDHDHDEDEDEERSEAERQVLVTALEVFRHFFLKKTNKHANLRPLLLNV